MSAVSIVPATLSDLYALQDVALNSYGEHYLHLWNDGGAWYIEKSFSESTLKKEMEDANAAFFLVYAQEQLVGFLKLNINKELDTYTAEEALELERIYLLKEASGNGTGRQVMAFTKQFAEKRNKKVIWLKAMDTSHDAIRFYKQNGYTQCGTYLLNFEPMKPEYRGMVVMKLELS